MSFPFFLTTSEEKAKNYYDNVSYQDKPIQLQIKEAHAILDDEIPGLWFDVKGDCFGYSWNVKYLDNLIIEKTPHLDPDEIRKRVKQYNEFVEKCKEKGIAVVSVYKKPRAWNDNQRYYVFNLLSDNHYYKHEAHIASKLQHKKRIVLDFFKEEWFESMDQQNKDN